MPNSNIATPRAAAPGRKASGRAKLGYFVVMATLALALVAIGFSPTFYLSALFGAATLPLSLVLHGVLLTAWFLVFLLQAILVAQGRTADHRRLGMLALALVIAVVSSTLVVMRDQVPRIAASGVDVEAALDRVSPLVWSGIAMLTAFTALVTAAIVCVRRTQAHRRLMLLASISLLPPAAARIFGAGTPGTAATVLLLVLSLFIYDTWRRGRPHPATLIGGLGLILFSAVMIRVVASSELGRAFVLSLR